VKWVALCRADEVLEGAGRGFEFGEGTSYHALFVIRTDGELRGYVNSCPHAGTTLDWMQDRFFGSDGLLFCGTHGAKFRPADGLCVWGPCFGMSLKPTAFRITDGMIEAEIA
jgi:nitrite reductase/ring-hydroxylating ferredoxin subunit